MCIASLKSMTLALKAKKALSKENIFSEVVKLEPNMTQKGCAYGIQFDCFQLNHSLDVLNVNRIKYTEIINDLSR